MNRYLRLAMTLITLSLVSACLEEVQTTTPGNNDSESSEPASSSIKLDCDTPGALTGTGLDTDAKKNILCLHNKFRSDVAQGEVMGYNLMLPAASNMQAMSWDDELEIVAQNYADNCVFEHNPNRTSDYMALDGNPDITAVGENIAWHSQVNINSVEVLFQLYVDEASDWSYGELASSDYCDDICGHATQIFWANTRYVGCAVSQCDASEDISAGLFLVCNYGQAGNFITQHPYIEAAASEDICSDNREGSQPECTEGLTHSADYSDGF